MPDSADNRRPELTRRRALQKAALGATGLTVVLAGCAGGNGGDDGNGDETTTTTMAGNGDETTTTTMAGNGDEPRTTVVTGSDGGTGTVWNPYAFEEGEFYRYEMLDYGERIGTVTWEVLSLSDDEQSVTVRVSGEFEGQTFETTTSGPPETVHTNLLGTPAGPIVFLAFYSPFVGAYQGQQLAVGRGWTHAGGGSELSYRIVRTDRIADRDVFVSVLREDGDPVWESWIDPDLAFAAKTLIYDDEGEVETEVTLIEYRAN